MYGLSILFVFFCTLNSGCLDERVKLLVKYLGGVLGRFGVKDPKSSALVNLSDS